MSRTIAIDFGTSSSSVAISVKGKTKIIFSPVNERSTSSVVTLHDGKIIVGDEEACANAGAVPDLKRIIGRNYDDKIVKEYQAPLKPNENMTVAIGERDFRIEEVVAVLFGYMTYGLISADRAVITVPASFGKGQLEATKHAGGIAGFREVELIEETTAVAIALAKEIKVPRQRTLIFQLGGGTIDVAIFDITKTSIRLLGNACSSTFGGIEFDNNLLQYVKNCSKSKTTIDVKTMMELRRLCKKAKEKLTTAASARVTLKKSNVDVEISRLKFNENNKVLCAVIGKMIDMAILAAHVKKIDKYILVGQGSLMPSIKFLLAERLKESKQSEVLDINEAAVKGAAKHAETIWSTSNSKKRKSRVYCEKTETHFVIVRDGQITHSANEPEKRQAEQLLGVTLEDLQKLANEEKMHTTITVRSTKSVENERSMERVKDLFKIDKKTRELEKRASELYAKVIRLNKTQGHREDIKKWCEDMEIWKNEGQFTEQQVAAKEKALIQRQKSNRLSRR